MSELILQGRRLGEAELSFVQQLVREHPQWNRAQLSRHLAESWDWRNGAGQLKDIAARSLLRKLHDRGLIALPPPRNGNGNGQRHRGLPELSMEFPIDQPLASLQPICFQPVNSVLQRRLFAQQLKSFHYQGYQGPVGENLQYLVYEGQGRLLALMLFGAAAWHLQARDQFIGWSVAQRRQRLHLLANQQRFLILPWVKVPHLASHLLGRVVRRLSADWQARYGHPILLLESFVDRQRFTATSYRAANWVDVGLTQGRTRNDRYRQIEVPPKQIFLYGLCRDFRRRLTTPTQFQPTYVTPMLQ